MQRRAECGAMEVVGCSEKGAQMPKLTSPKLMPSSSVRQNSVPARWYRRKKVLKKQPKSGIDDGGTYLAKKEENKKDAKEQVQATP